MKKCGVLLMWVGVFLLSCPGAGFSAGRLLIVHSYHAEMYHVQAINRGIRRALSDTDVTIEEMYMDTKRKTSEKWMKAAGRVAMEKVADFTPDVVVTVDDNAQAYFARHYAGKKSPQFIFCAVDFDIAQYGFPADNVTGVPAPPYWEGSIDLLLRIRPEVKKVAVLSDDSPSGRAVIEKLKELPEGPVSVVSYDRVDSFEKWQAKISAYQGSVDALAVVLYHRLKKTSQDDRLVSPAEVIQWTLEHNRLPTIGFYDFVIQDGVFCGVVWSGENDGFAVGNIAKAMLNGKTADQIPMHPSSHGNVMINLLSARRLGITVPFEVLETADEVVR